MLKKEKGNNCTTLFNSLLKERQHYCTGTGLSGSCSLPSLIDIPEEIFMTPWDSSHLYPLVFFHVLSKM